MGCGSRNDGRFRKEDLCLTYLKVVSLSLVVFQGEEWHCSTCALDDWSEHNAPENTDGMGAVDVYCGLSARFGVDTSAFNLPVDVRLVRVDVAHAGNHTPPRQGSVPQRVFLSRGRSWACIPR